LDTGVAYFGVDCEEFFLVVIAREVVLLAAADGGVSVCVKDGRVSRRCDLLSGAWISDWQGVCFGVERGGGVERS
jgi:hypothetical protein